MLRNCFPLRKIPKTKKKIQALQPFLHLNTLCIKRLELLTKKVDTLTDDHYNIC